MIKERVLVVHNNYQQRGGEDTVVEAEISLLKQNGHLVELFEKSNHSISEMPKVKLAYSTIWSSDSAQEFSNVLTSFKPDIVHVHNTFPLISPAIYWVAQRHNIPVVQTLHNFRLFCPQGMLLRDSKVCEDCLGKVPWRGVLNKCYRESYLQSAVLSSMLITHRLMGTWQNKVSRYIALNKFCRDKFIEGGLPAAKISVKPNFVDFGIPVDYERSGFLYVGRLSHEKGIATLANALRNDTYSFIRVAGSGDQEDLLRPYSNVKLLGMLNQDAIRDEMYRASALVMPSIWYENFPRTLVEAFACGLPVVASRIGALADLVEDGVTGLLFDPSSSEDLAKKLRWVRENPEEMKKMGQSARQHYLSSFTPAINYKQLIDIYRQAMGKNGMIESE